MKRELVLKIILARHTIGVMGSGSEEHLAFANALGELLARLGVNLLTGGGGGVMKAVSHAFTASPNRTSGICIGILPCAEGKPAECKPGYPNEYVELPIYTHLPHSGALGERETSRNHINVLSSHAIVVLPGGEGTESEVALAVRYGKPVVIFTADEALVGELPAEVARVGTIGAVEEFLMRALDADSTRDDRGR